MPLYKVKYNIVGACGFLDWGLDHLHHPTICQMPVRLRSMLKDQSNCQTE